MKKYFALILSVIVILTCFTACKGVKNGAIVENGAGEQVAIVTTPDGGVARDEAGNIIVLVTDENGKNVKDENGEYKTNAIAMDHAIVLGRRVEAANYSVEIPNGWSDALTLNDLSITKDGTEESLVITTKDGTVSQAIETVSLIFSNMKKMYPNGDFRNETVEINDSITASYISAYIPNLKTDENGNAVAGFVAYFFFERGGNTYTCKIEGRRDINENLKEFTDILSTINFR